MKAKWLAYCVLSVLVCGSTISQTKYTNRDETTTSLGTSIASVDGFTNFGLQFGVSRKGTMAAGLFASMDDSKNTTKSLGFFLEGAIVKPNEQSIVGLDVHLSISKIAHHVLSGEKDYSGTGFSIGGELYLMPLDTHFSPFIQLGQSFVKISTGESTNASTSTTSGGFGCDCYITDGSSRPRVIITPGVIFGEQNTTILELDVAVVLRRGVVKK